MSFVLIESRRPNGYIHSQSFTIRISALASPSRDTARAIGSSGTSYSVEESFAFCERLARSHYENFPVASFFVPPKKRRYLWSMYAFARIADDFADEGDTLREKRLEHLDRWGEYLDECFESKATHPVFIALAETVRRCNIPKQPLADLLTAFRMDVTQNRYNTFADLLYYCKHSANPVGQLVLHVFGNATDRTILLSDSICTALQLTNFWQDVAVDWQKGRLYIPLEDCSRFGYTEQDIERRIVDDRLRNLMAFEVDRTREMFVEGRPLLTEAIPELHLELKLTWQGGMTILEKIERLQYNVLHQRPALSMWDKLSILGTSLLRLT